MGVVLRCRLSDTKGKKCNSGGSGKSCAGHRQPPLSMPPITPGIVMAFADWLGNRARSERTTKFDEFKQVLTGLTHLADMVTHRRRRTFMTVLGLYIFA